VSWVSRSRGTATAIEAVNGDRPQTFESAAGALGGIQNMAGAEIWKYPVTAEYMSTSRSLLFLMQNPTW
jgi:hypothetical protein